MKTMICDLPIDLREEILSRVPSKSRKAVRLTCKEWNTCLTKMNQRKLAAEAKEGESRMIMLMHNEVYLMSIVVNENPSTKFLGKLTCLNEQVKISSAFHCEGLLLCILKDDDTKVVVWNPYLGQTRWIETRYSHRGEKGWFTKGYKYALGYVNNKNNKSCRNHKILRFRDYYYCGDRYSMYEIYDFDSGDLWKTINNVPPRWRTYQSGISLKGNIYWSASPKVGNKENHLLCFDFTRERFGPFIPLPFIAGNDDTMTLSCVREEKLVALVENLERNPNKIDIWITTKIKAKKVWWRKLVALDEEPDHHPIVSLNFFIDEEKKVLVCFDYDYEEDTSNRHILNIIGEARYLRKLDLGECEDEEDCCYPQVVCSYVPSSLNMKQHIYKKKRRQKRKTKQLRKASIR